MWVTGVVFHSTYNLSLVTISCKSSFSYNPYNGQLLNGSNSKYDRQSYSPTCTSQQNLLKCNEQP